MVALLEYVNHKPKIDPDCPQKLTYGIKQTTITVCWSCKTEKHTDNVTIRHDFLVLGAPPFYKHHIAVGLVTVSGPKHVSNYEMKQGQSYNKM